MIKQTEAEAVLCAVLRTLAIEEMSPDIVRCMLSRVARKVGLPDSLRYQELFDAMIASPAVELEATPFVVKQGGIIGAEGRIVVGKMQAIVRLREGARTESDEDVIEALIKKAESGADETGQFLGHGMRTHLA